MIRGGAALLLATSLTGRSAAAAPSLAQNEPPAGQSPNGSLTNAELDTAPVLTAPVLQGPAVCEKASAPTFSEGALSLVEVIVRRDGSVAACRQAEGQAFDALDTACSCALAFRYAAATRNGDPVSARVLQEILFTTETRTTDKDASALAGDAPSPSDSLAPPITTASAPTQEAAPPPSPQSPPAEVPGRAAEELEVLVLGRSPLSALRRGANAVEVIDINDKKGSAQDLGERLAQSSTMSVQRAGGLGSRTTFGLLGMTGDRVRFLLDGVPLEFSGFPFGAANVPVNLVDRVEIYDGVVPVQFGADALGGVVHLVTDPDFRSSRATASYELASFNTNRLSVSAKYFGRGSPWFLRGGAYLDDTSNNYENTVEVFDDEGSLSEARLPRFHDKYRAYGATLTAGLLDRSYADRVSVSLYFGGGLRDVQSNPSGIVPYGEVVYEKTSGGTSLRYGKAFSDRVRLDLTLGYNYRKTTFTDLSNCRYDWYGRCFLQLPLSGEISGIPEDSYDVTNTAFSRTTLYVQIADFAQVRLGVAPSFSTRLGKDRAVAEGIYDPRTTPRVQDTAVSGLELETDHFADRLKQVLFGKLYFQSTRSDQELPTGEISHLENTSLRFGGGDALRLFLTDDVFTKASYEFATRLPSADESFGDGGLVVQNIELRPEESHNGNLGLHIDELNALGGLLSSSLVGRMRSTSELITLLSDGSYFQYQNVLRAIAFGVGATAAYEPVAKWLRLSGQLNYQDVRNSSTEGPYASFRGDRIPNLPYFGAAAAIAVAKSTLGFPNDRAELELSARYVHEFALGWESAGNEETRLSTPSQLVHSLRLSYSPQGTPFSCTSSVEIHNITDERVFDLYGAERPGRSLHAKFTAEYQ